MCLVQDPTESPFSKYGSGDLVKARVITLRDRPITELVIDCLFCNRSMKHIRAESRECCLPGKNKVFEVQGRGHRSKLHWLSSQNRKGESTSLKSHTTLNTALHMSDVVCKSILFLCVLYSLGSKSGASTQLLELSIKPRYLNQLVQNVILIILSVMAAKGVTDFTYLLNPPLSVGCSIDGFIKMVRKVF